MKREATVPKPSKLLSLIESELPERPCWIDPGILPKGGTLLFGGHAKTGKSFIMLELARALSTGTCPFGYNKIKVYEPVKVLYIEQELGEYGLQKRVKNIFAEEDVKVFGPKMWYASKIPQMQLDTQEGRGILFDLVETVQPQVLILDPIGRMHGYDENRSDQINELFASLEYLVKVFSQNDMSLVISHHFGKPGTDPKTTRDPLDPYNFRGSSKFFDNPDTLITVAKKERLDTPWKSWNVIMRQELRQDEPMSDMLLTVNKEKDFRVRFKALLDDTPKDKDKKSTKKKGDPGEGMPTKQFTFAS